MQAMDALNHRYVRGTIKVWPQGAYLHWQVNQERISANYPTNWYGVHIA